MRLSKCAVLCLFVVAFVVVQANADVDNLVGDNSSFEDDYTDWSEGLSGAAEAVHGISTDAMDGSKSALIEISAITGTNWHIGTTNNLVNLDSGTLYTADFFAKAEADRVISLELKAAPPLPYAWIGGGDIDITTVWTEYSRTFTPSVDYPVDAAAQICFWVGQTTDNVWLDGVRVYEGDKQDRPTSSVEAEGKLVTSWAAIKSSH